MGEGKKETEHYEFFGPCSFADEQEYCELVEKMVLYYDRRGKHYKRLYLVLSGVRLTLVALIPLLALSECRLLNPYTLTAISSFALIAEGFLNLTACHDKWKSYRRTCDKLCMDHRLYIAGVGNYQQKKNKLDEFAARCESIMNDEGILWEDLIDKIASKQKEGD